MKMHMPVEQLHAVGLAEVTEGIMRGDNPTAVGGDATDRGLNLFFQLIEELGSEWNISRCDSNERRCGYGEEEDGRRPYRERGHGRSRCGEHSSDRLSGWRAGNGC